MREEFKVHCLKILPEQNLAFEVDLARFTTLRVRCIAEMVVFPDTQEQLIVAVKSCEEYQEPYIVLGGGSNILFVGGRYRGMVLIMREYLCAVTWNESQCFASSGVMLPSLSMQASLRGLSGLEFACGLPGTVGGGVVMNAGCYGQEMKDIVRSVTILENGKIQKIERENCEFIYRHSLFSKRKCVILEVEYQLTPLPIERIRSRMRENREKRSESQPVGACTMGSVFKNPVSGKAWELIFGAGLGGAKVGGAKVSEKHNNFIVCRSATWQQVVRLIMDIVDKVYERYHILLETEIKIAGDEEIVACILWRLSHPHDLQPWQG